MDLGCQSVNKVVFESRGCDTPCDRTRKWFCSAPSTRDSFHLNHDHNDVMPPSNQQPAAPSRAEIIAKMEEYAEKYVY